MTASEKQLLSNLAGRGWYCEDCNQLISNENYPYHNADHTLRRITWEFDKR